MELVAGHGALPGLELQFYRIHIPLGHAGCHTLGYGVAQGCICIGLFSYGPGLAVNAYLVLVRSMA
jgi:hypothetical protein